jgi:hypothetical protein
MKPRCNGPEVIGETSARRGSEMVRISVEVGGGAARSRVMVQAESIERALEIARRHNPDKECRVTFPLDPETFFIEDPVAGVEETAA